MAPCLRKHGAIFMFSCNSNPFALASKEVHKLFTGLCLIEGTAEIGSRGDGVLLFHATHLHTHMLSFDDDHGSHGMERLLDAVLNLLCHTLLYLQAVAVDVHHTGNLAETGDVAIGNVSHMNFAVKGEHMVFAHREEVNVFDNDHLTVFFLKKGIGEHLMCIL